MYKNELIVANVGDSRGVICDAKGNTIPLSFDHKPDQVSQKLCSCITVMQFSWTYNNLL